MDITSYSSERIRHGLNRAKQNNPDSNDQIRILFSPTTIDEENFDRVCDIYSRIDPDNYETVVIVETHDKMLDKKLPMPSNNYFETSLGRVAVNDYVRNEFCDEDDDFFIHDEGFSKEMSLFHQLMMLQCRMGEFSMVSIQIADQSPSIVKELAYVLQEVLASRQALLVFCCDLDHEYKNEFETVKEMMREENESGLLNYLNSGNSKINGSSTFISGVLVGNRWELSYNFLNGEDGNYTGSLLTGYAERQRVNF